MLLAAMPEMIDASARRHILHFRAPRLSFVKRKVLKAVRTEEHQRNRWLVLLRKNYGKCVARLAVTANKGSMETREDIWTEAMRSARRGDVAAYERMLGEVAIILRRIVERRLTRFGLSTAETEDIVQEVLIGLHTKRFSWDETRPFLPWLYAIVHYKLVDAVRRIGREARRHLDLRPAEWERLFAAPDVDMDRATVDLDRHLSQLPPHQRDVVQALAVEGVPVKVAAKRLQVSEGSVRMTLHRALTRLSSRAEAASGQAGDEDR